MEMRRREFLSTALGLVVVVPAGAVLGGCSSGGGGASGPTFNDAGAGSGASTLSFTSSRTLGHTHDFTLSAAAVDTPPASGIEQETSTNVGHRHNVVLTEQQLADIRDGQTVIVETSQQNGHTHSFSFSR